MIKIKENYQVLTPAYGRDYKDPKDAIKDFKDGKDFFLNSMLYGFTYCSIRDFAKNTVVNIRYNNKTEVIPFKV